MGEDLKPEILSDLLKSRLDEGKELLKIYTQVGIVFLAINGALATLAFNDHASHRWLFETVGLATALFFIWVCANEKKVRVALERDVNALNQRLGAPLQNVAFLYLSYTARASVVWSFLAALGWIVALVLYR